MAVEFGWLIENGKRQGEGLAYRYINNDNGGLPDWTPDPDRALRFARRADAEQFAHHDEDAWSIVEHAWDDGSVAPQLSPSQVEEIATKHAESGFYQGEYVWWKFHQNAHLHAFVREILGAPR